MLVSNLDELVLTCLDQNARIGIEEAIKCYNSGAYRAAIVTTYVTICFDLIEKLKSLAASGDGDAKTAESELTAAQIQHDQGNQQGIERLLKFERGLLELFKDKFEFSGVNEFNDLSRLREDRNRCAHPSFLKTDVPFTPSAEQARLHIRNAIVHVCSQEPKQGK